MSAEDLPLKYSFCSRSALDTHVFGQRLGRVLKRMHAQRPHTDPYAPDDTAPFVVALHGDLGAGKTTLTQGIAAGLGIEAQVTSPTFTLINEYATTNKTPENEIRLVHIDSYRLGDAAAAEQEALALGLDDLWADAAIVVIEWAERLLSLLPEDHLRITLCHGVGEPAAPPESTPESIPESMSVRRIACEARGPVSAALLRELADQELTDQDKTAVEHR